MAALEWDQVGERFYQSGIDRGVLSIGSGIVVPWNGLTGLEEGTNSDLSSFYLDGVKFLEHVTPGDFIGKLSAFTYPNEFDRALGQAEIADGLAVYEQPPVTFNLSYRTRLSNDLNEDYGYKIHLLYNLSAIPDSYKHETLTESADLGEFSWSLTGIPATVHQKRSTVRVTIDSTRTDPSVLQDLEDALYGTETTDPHFPSILEVRNIYGELGGLVIVENSDGSWVAIDPSDDFISMIDSTTFMIEHANAFFLDLDHEIYQITDTVTPLP